MNEMLSAVIAERGQPRPGLTPETVHPLLQARSAAVPDMQIVIWDDVRAVEALWLDFEPHADCTIFQKFDYLAAWHDHIGARAAVRPAVVVLRREREILAILPLGVSADGTIRRLTWLGQDLGDYLGPLLARDFSALVSSAQFVALWDEILNVLQSNPRLSFDIAAMCKMPSCIGAQTNPFMALPVARHASDGFIATLKAPWDEFYSAKRSSKARRQDKSKRSRLCENGDVTMTTVARDEIAETIDTLLAQKSAVFARKGIPDPFQRPGYRDFFLRLALEPRTRDLVHVSRLDVGGKPAAVNLGLEYRGRYSLCLVSYDEKFARFSPGAIHLNELLRRAVDRGLHEFDFLVGLQRLKREWSDRRIELYDHIAGATARGRLAAAVLRLLAAMKRTVKTNPVLWDAFLRLREATAPLRGAARQSED